MTLEIQIPACDRNKNEAGLNLLNWIATLSLLIIRSPTAIYIYIYKMIKKTLHRLTSTQKDHTLLHPYK